MKKRFKIVLSLILSVILTCTLSMSYFVYALGGWSVDFGNYSLEYDLNGISFNATITGFTGTLPDDFTVPSSLNGHTVTKIGDAAFSPNYSGCSIKKLIIPSSVTEIGNMSFVMSQSLSEVNFSEGIETLGGFAFASCSSLKKIELPSSLKQVDGSFAGCGLTDITVAEGNQNFCAVNNVLFSKDMESIYQYHLGSDDISYTVPDSVKNICNGAFGFSKLEAVKLSSNTETIAINAFISSNIVGIDLPETLKSIDESAFYGCSELKSVSFLSRTVTINGDAFISCNDFSIRGYAGSTAEAYAKSKLKAFEFLDTADLNLNSGVTVGSIKSDYNSSYTVSIKDCLGTELSDDRLIGNGTTISVRDAYGTFVAEKNVYITGDINGDGLHNIDDYNYLKDVAIYRSELPDNPAITAEADLNDDGVVDFFDVAQYDLYLNSLS